MARAHNPASVAYPFIDARLVESGCACALMVCLASAWCLAPYGANAVLASLGVSFRLNYAPLGEHGDRLDSAGLGAMAPSNRNAATHGVRPTPSAQGRVRPLALAAMSAAVGQRVGMGGVEAVDDGVLVGEGFGLGAGLAAHVHDVCDMVFEDLAHACHGFRKASIARLASSRLALGLLERNRPTVRSTALNLGSSESPG
jgi:hypothetical protein